MLHGITQCYRPPGRADIPAFSPAEAGTRLSDPGKGVVVLKKKWGRLKQDLDISYIEYYVCSTEIILHYVSVSNQLQQWTNFCTNFSPEVGGMGDASPCRKSGGRRPPASPLHYTPEPGGMQG